MQLKTDRLIITKFTLDMAQAVHQNSLDEDTRRFLPDEVFETVDAAKETIIFLMSQYENSDSVGPLVYPVLLADGTNIGYVQAVPTENGAWEIGGEEKYAVENRPPDHYRLYFRHGTDCSSKFS